MANSRQYVRFPSVILRREVELLHFGDQDYPLIFIPTSKTIHNATLPSSIAVNYC